MAAFAQFAEILCWRSVRWSDSSVVTMAAPILAIPAACLVKSYLMCHRI